MPINNSPLPKPVHQVMVSSTFTNLKVHRAAIIDALPKYGLHANVMENDSASLLDVLDSSLRMVQESAAYVGIISLKYGQIPECEHRNPGNLSVTELEFNEAQRLGRPTLLFVMGDKHQGGKDDFERDPDKEAKLDAFRVRAKLSGPGSKVNRVYAEFNSLEEFQEKVGPALAKLAKSLESPEVVSKVQRQANSEPVANHIPKPPAFYAEPDYLGSHKFVGRAAQLQELNDWANPADPTNLLLFEAIGGNGKSMLTWEWVKNHAPTTRQDWAGRFWYSFYERGAVMADFCQHALAYMTERPLDDFKKKKTTELKEELLLLLHEKPWLFVLDGLERVLVAYHRIDAAELPDEAANAPTDQMANRTPTDTIRDEDGDLLRALATATPSKILVTTRLTPRALLNPSGQPLPGAKRITLPGLRPPDAELMLRSCGLNKEIRGDSAAIQNYLTTNCDNHPLVIGILGGLINNYRPDPGNFDAWVADPNGGAKLDLARLDLIQRRNHILVEALKDLSPDGKQLLSVLSLIGQSVDYKTLKAFSPIPIHSNEKEKQFEAIVSDLEQRGLLQNENLSGRYDLHPVVRGLVSSLLVDSERKKQGQKVVDYFSAMAHISYDQVERLEDLQPNLLVIRTLIQIGLYNEAASAYRGNLSEVLLFRLEAYSQTLALLRPFFSEDWLSLPKMVNLFDASYLRSSASIALSRLGMNREAGAVSIQQVKNHLANRHWSLLCTSLRNLSIDLDVQRFYSKSFRISKFALDLAEAMNSKQDIFMGQLWLLTRHYRSGSWAEARSAWQTLDKMGRAWSRAVYRPGDAEMRHAYLSYFLGSLEQSEIDTVEQLATKAKSQVVIRSIKSLRGLHFIDKGKFRLAQESMAQAVQMAREAGLCDTSAEAWLVFAKYRQGLLTDIHTELERLSQPPNPHHRVIAELWFEIGEAERAKEAALKAYTNAWADGEPFVFRHELTKTTELLNRMNVPIPNLPPYDPAKDEPYPWEADIRKAIEEIKAKNAAEKRAETELD